MAWYRAVVLNTPRDIGPGLVNQVGCWKFNFDFLFYLKLSKTRIGERKEGREGTGKEREGEERRGQRKEKNYRRERIRERNGEEERREKESPRAGLVKPVLKRNQETTAEKYTGYVSIIVTGRTAILLQAIPHGHELGRTRSPRTATQSWFGSTRPTALPESIWRNPAWIALSTSRPLVCRDMDS